MSLKKRDQNFSNERLEFLAMSNLSPAITYYFIYTGAQAMKQLFSINNSRSSLLEILSVIQNTFPLFKHSSGTCSCSYYKINIIKSERSERGKTRPVHIVGKKEQKISEKLWGMKALL